MTIRGIGSNSILVHNACKLNFIRKSASQIEKMLGAKSGYFHRVVKQDILKQAGKSVLKRLGPNPDILVLNDGTIKLVSRVYKGVSIVTGLNIYDFAP